jgi:hypothetical protein
MMNGVRFSDAVSRMCGNCGRGPRLVRTQQRVGVSMMTRKV